MVCEKCEKKVARLANPDTWKTGSRNTVEGGRKVNENKLLTMRGSHGKINPYSTGSYGRCRLCRSSVHQSGAAYCQQCAYKQGICAMCGVKMLDTKNFKMSST